MPPLYGGQYGNSNLLAGNVKWQLNVAVTARKSLRRRHFRQLLPLATVIGNRWQLSIATSREFLRPVRSRFAIPNNAEVLVRSEIISRDLFAGALLRSMQQYPSVPGDSARARLPAVTGRRNTMKECGQTMRAERSRIMKCVVLVDPSDVQWKPSASDFLGAQIWFDLDTVWYALLFRTDGITGFAAESLSEAITWFKDVHLRRLLIDNLATR